MSIEPEQVTTVSRTALVHFGDSDEEVYAKAAAIYKANIIRRFGRLPSWPELAKREDRAAGRAPKMGDVLMDVQRSAILAARRRQAEVTEGITLAGLI